MSTAGSTCWAVIRAAAAVSPAELEHEPASLLQALS
jgi:hypothetical protein